MKKLIYLAFFVAIFLQTVEYAYAVPYSFYGITNNNVSDVTTGENQLSMNVTDALNGQVLFAFGNTGPNNSSITDIYFQDEIPLLLYANYVLSSSPNVEFTAGANPGNVPGSQLVDFIVATDGSYDSTPPAQPNGVNPGEWLNILLTITPSYDFDDVIAALDDASFRVGIHVQGFATGGSESFVNEPGNPVPEPGTLVLLGAGFLGLAIYGKRRNNR